ncbi:OmpH family outer membrane protein [Puia dinghuensis]|uniref:Membrane protein n=1 Tax=Puia dinghuensis TaxID=1792502 RepID=A0A8J2UGP9_9BACT|nr:OmpH family outer membrane protein [Puia dinghuensis]GGB15046.1 membrane protein [Puia dinghuensis]
MKYISTILSVVALGLVAVLYLTQTRQLEQMKKNTGGEPKNPGIGFKMAYFDMDSLETHYEEFRDAQAQVKEQDNRMTQELSSLDRSNQKKIDGWRQKQQSNTMTQAEGEQAQREYQEMQQQFASRKQELEQALYKRTEDLKTNLRKKIEDFLKEYNKQKGFSYIIQYDANSFIYAKDSLYNITSDLVDGLNAAYKKK